MTDKLIKIVDHITPNARGIGHSCVIGKWSPKPRKKCDACKTESERKKNGKGGVT